MFPFLVYMKAIHFLLSYNFLICWVSEWVSEVAQSCPTLCDPVECSPPGSSVHGTLQARILEWVAISFSRGSSQPRDRTQVSRIAGRCFNLWATREAPVNRVDRYNVWLVFPSYFAKSTWRSNVKLYPIPNLPQGLLCLRQGNIKIHPGCLCALPSFYLWST